MLSSSYREDFETLSHVPCFSAGFCFRQPLTQSNTRHLPSRQPSYTHVYATGGRAMAAQALRLSTLVFLISLLIFGTTSAQIDIPVEQDDYYDGALTSLTAIDSITTGAPDLTLGGNFLLTISTLSLADYAAALGVPESAIADLHPRELLETIIGPAMYGEAERVFDTVTIGALEAGRMRSNDTRAGPLMLMSKQGNTLIVASAQVSGGEYEATAYAILESITFEAQEN
jgi:hypothetical protein